MDEPLDVVLIGGGIMSATLGVLLQELEPSWSIKLIERLDSPAAESSGPWNNAGTGHSALCELNYSPQNADGSVDISKAVNVNEQFQLSRQLWSFLVENGRIPDPDKFIHTVPHMSFVWGAENVDYLRKRYEALSVHPLFSGMEFSEDPEVIKGWAPLLLEGRSAKSLADEPIAATWTNAGTDVDFGSLTSILTRTLVDKGADLETGLRDHRPAPDHGRLLAHLRPQRDREVPPTFPLRLRRRRRLRAAAAAEGRDPGDPRLRRLPRLG